MSQMVVKYGIESTEYCRKFPPDVTYRYVGHYCLRAHNLYDLKTRKQFMNSPKSSRDNFVHFVFTENDIKRKIAY